MNTLSKDMCRVLRMIRYCPSVNVPDHFVLMQLSYVNVIFLTTFSKSLCEDIVHPQGVLPVCNTET